MALLKLPGLIDVHVHLREPGAIQKEDFASGGRAGLAGGFTYLLDMPNNPTPTLSLERLQEKIECAQKSPIDIGFHFGTTGHNLEEFPKVWDHPRVFGLKLYCNHTTGELLVEDRPVLNNIFKSWESSKPILVHAEGPQLAMALELAQQYGRRLHVCHISLASEVEMVRKVKKQAKQAGQIVSAGATPHHLFLSEQDREKLGSWGIMKPPLATSLDVAALWEGLRDGTVDMIETDHAPHTKEEKQKQPPPFGVPGLETSLPLMLSAVAEGRISLDMIGKLMYDNATRIFAIPTQPDTYIEIDPEKQFVIGEHGYQSKCGWSPFEGMSLPGPVQKVVLRGKTLMQDGVLV